MIHWHTVEPFLKDTLNLLMGADEFKSFRLVGGTALSLQLGHRMSVDIDLFTDELYENVDFDVLDKFLDQNFEIVQKTNGPVGMGRSYVVGKDKDAKVKLDLYFTDPYIRPFLLEDGIRMATVDEIAAMKMNVIGRKGRKKDFYDLHEINLSIDNLLSLHEERYPYDHDPKLLVDNLTDFKMADDDLDPICLKGKYWELIKLDFLESVEIYSLNNE